MSDITSSITGAKAPAGQASSEHPYKIEETHWGYIIGATGSAGRGIAVAQTLSLLIGAGFLAAAISLWLFPALVFGVDALFMRFFATVLFGSMSALFLWYASRGVRSEVQIDNSRGEIREVIRNKAGKMTLLGSYGFDSVGGVFLEPTDKPKDSNSKDSNLVLRYRSTGGSLVVASGRKTDLAELRDRISRDVMIGSEDAPTDAV